MLRVFLGSTAVVCFLSLAIQTRAADQTQATNVTLVPTGSSWRYLVTPPSPDIVGWTRWRESGFDDSSWPSGPAQLGYGDGDERTVLGYGPDPNNKYITTFFRHAFTVEGGTGFTNLTLGLLRDDGAVVYLNGSEVFRSNMPSGAINYFTRASSTVGNADESTYFPSAVDPGLLRDGTNILAVEIHQADPTSSDISFDLRLTGVSLIGPPLILVQPRRQVAAAGGTATFSVRAGGTAPLSYQWSADGFDIEGGTGASLTLTNVTAEDQRLYRVVVTNRLGSATSDKVGLELVNLTGDFFQIAGLLTNNAQALEHETLTGDDRGGIAVSFGDLLVTGDRATARFALEDLSGAKSLERVEDALVSDLRSGRVYALANGSTHLTGGGLLDTLIEISGVSGAPTGNTVELSSAIQLGGCSGCMGVFAGFGRILLHDGERAFTILLPSGEVIEHGPMEVGAHQFSESWANWGVAEYFDESSWLVYVRDYQTIVRTRVPDGLTLPVARFEDLSDMASFTVSPLLNRWYFHHEGGSQFGGGDETVGFADALLAHDQQAQAPAILLGPRDRRIDLGSNVTFSVTALGAQLNYQWRFNGKDIAGATGRELVLEGVTGTDVGLYSVEVMNAQGSALSEAVLLDVVVEGDGGAVSSVAVFGAPGDPAWNADVEGQLEGTGLFDGVDAFQVSFPAPVPTLEELEVYDAILVYSDQGFSDGVAFGNVLADYVNSGGGLVVATFAHDGSLQGRIAEEGYLPFVNSSGVAFGSLSLVAVDQTHPILDTVESFNGGESSYHNDPAELTAGAQLVARWSNGRPLVAVQESKGRVAGLNFFPPSSDARGDFWDARTDGGKLMANALVWAGGGRSVTVPLVSPGIRRQPEGGAVLQGLDAKLSVSAYGSPPLNYQWFFNGQPLNDETNKSLTLVSVGSDASGDYQVVISNSYGEVRSDTVALEVQPTRGVAGYFTDYNSSETGLADSIAQAGFTPLRIPAIGTFDLSRLQMLWINEISDPPSSELRLRLPAIRDWVSQGGKLVVHQSYLYTSETLSSNPLLVGVRGTQFENYYDFDVNLILPTANLVVNGPHGVLNNTSLDSQEVFYTAFARRTTLPAGSRALLSAGTDSSRVLAFAYGLGAGMVYYSSFQLEYYLEQSNSSVAAVARQVYAPNVAEFAAAYQSVGGPVILEQPRNIRAVAGSEPSFFVGATGLAPLRYQWFRDGTPLPDAVENPLRLPEVSVGDVGTYSVVVSNSIGSRTTAGASLTVVPRMSIGLFSDPRYVFSAGPVESLRFTLEQSGHLTRPFTNLLDGVSTDVLVFPPFWNRALAPDLDDSSVALLRAFVAEGGLIIVLAGDANIEFLNEIFGLSVSSYGCYGQIEFSRTAAAAGTPFAYNPPVLAANYCTYPLAPGSWPSDAVPLYTEPSIGSMATLIPYGAGTLVHLGWDWNDAPPQGGQEGGGTDLLGSAVVAKGILPPMSEVSIPLVPAGATWRYRDDGGDQGSAWRGLAFDDTAWRSGPAQLGYGDGDEMTQVRFGSDPNNKFITTYFRHEFMVESPSSLSGLSLGLLRDDGAAVYLNGIEVVRDCLDPAATYNTLATCTISGVDERLFQSYRIDPGLLRDGLNLLAVEIHQADRTSSDISFDLELAGVMPLGEPVILTQPAGQSVAEGVTMGLSVVAAGVGPLSYQWSFGDQVIEGASSAILVLDSASSAQSGRYSVVVSNALGSVISSEALVEVVRFDEGSFRISGLSTAGVGVVDIGPLAGDDRGGLAVSGEQLFYSGDQATVRASAADLSGPVALGTVYDGLVSDLKTETVYVLANGSTPVTTAGGVVTALVELDGASGQPTGSSISLSRAVDLRNRYGELGLFSGLGRVVIHDGRRAWSIDLPSGRVVGLGTVTIPAHHFSESWAYWGVAELVDGELWMVYVRDSRTIVRTRVSDGETRTVEAFSDLGDMASITVSVPYRRWYFHYQSSSQFGAVAEAIGFADAEFEAAVAPVAPLVVVEPADQMVAAGGAAVLRPVVRGSAPLQYQWFHDGDPLVEGTNASLTLRPARADQSGDYFVEVSNAAGSTTSANAVLTVIPLQGETFQILNLNSNNSGAVDAGALSGGSRAGIALSDRRAFYSGNNLVRFDLADLSGGEALFWAFDALVSDLGTETVYALAHDNVPVSGFDRVVSALLEVDGETGAATGSRVMLSEPIDLTGRFDAGLFAGLGRIVIHDGSQAWTIEVPSGQVLGLGPLTMAPHLLAGAVGFYWGVAEFVDDSISLVYTRDTQSIVRTRLSDGVTSTLASFVNLGGMSAITVSLPYNRWYFHHLSASQFSPLFQTVGYADAVFSSSAPPLEPAVIRSPLSQSIAVGGNADFRVTVRGTGPLEYQWFFEGDPIEGATNSVLRLRGVGEGEEGRYTVMVSNAAGAVASEEAVLTLVSPVSVAVFDDPNYVNTSNNRYAGSDSVQASLGWLGHQVSTFVNIATAAQGNMPLLFPGFELRDPIFALSEATRLNLQAFVAGGGVMILHGTGNDAGRPARFLNSVFDYGVQPAYAAGPFARTPLSAGTAFEGDPESLPANIYSSWLMTSSLPAGADVIYGDAETGAVVVFRFGSGKIIFLGWGWSDAVPLGGQDGGWLAVLESAMEETGPPSPVVPVILDQPGDRVALVGGAARFRVGAVGYPLNYQWSFKGEPLTGETNSVLLLRDLTVDQQGGYSVEISNFLGSVTSVEVLLRVVAPLTVGVYTDPRFVNPSGSPWGGAANVQATLLGLGHSVETFTTISSAVGNQVLLFPSFDFADPTSSLEMADRSALQSFAAQGGLVIVHGYYYNVQFINDLFGFSLGSYGYYGGEYSRTAAARGTPFETGPVRLPYNSDVFAISAATMPPLGGRDLYSMNDDVSVAALLPYGGGNIIFLGWNWYDAAPAGSQDNGWVETLNNAVLTRVGLFPSVPELTLQPEDQDVLSGLDVTFSIKAVGPQPLSVQWLFQGEALAGATDPVLTLSGVTEEQGGGYEAVVGNSSGSVTSRVARLEVRPTRGTVGYYRDRSSPPEILRQPIEAAGFTPYPIADIEAIDFSRLIALVIEGSGDGNLSPALVSRLADLHGWVVEGGGLIVHDGLGSGLSEPNPLLVGIAAPVSSDPGNDVQRIAPAENLVVDGPHGMLNDTVLDGFFDSYGGYVLQDQLPRGALPILGAGLDPNRVVAFSYGAGAGTVYYAAMRLGDLASQSPIVRNIYLPNVLEHVLAFGVTGAPFILGGPDSTAALAGGPAELLVAAGGAGPLAYQWFFDDVPVAGADGARLKIPVVTAERGGAYRVVVSNPLGSVTSGTALLSIVEPAPFRIRSLTPSGQIVEHRDVTGDDRGGLGLSATHIYYTGDSATGQFSATNLTGGTALGQRYDAMVSDLRARKLYTLANAGGLITGQGSAVTELIEIDDQAGELTANRITLSRPVVLDYDTGLFAGYGAVAFHTGGRVYRVELPSGLVLDLGAMDSFPHNFCESWAYWGVVEYYGGEAHLAYVRDSQTIVRTRVPDGETSVIASFTDLGDTCSFIVAPWLSRWYFHYQFSAQFGGEFETLGYGALFVDQPPRLQANLVNQVIDEDTSTTPVSLRIQDESLPEELLIRGFSSNPALVPEQGIVFGGSGVIRSLTVTPAPNQFGVAMITIQVTDTIGQTTNRTFQLTVNPVNDPPGLSPIPDQTAHVLTPLRVDLSVMEFDGDPVTLRLGEEAPPGAGIDSDQGLFRWLPSRENAGQTYSIPIIVTDNNGPALSTTNVFTVTVTDFVEITLGQTQVEAGGVGAVPLALFSSGGVVGAIDFTLEVPDERLTGLSARPLTPQVSGVTATVIGPGVWRLLCELGTGEVLTGSNRLAEIEFTARPGQSSAFVPLPMSLSPVTGESGGFVPRLLVNAGRVVVVGDRALLEAAIDREGHRSLVLYGRGGVTHTLESSVSAGDGGVWLVEWEGTLTGLRREFDLGAGGATLFYRARE